MINRKGFAVSVALFNGLLLVLGLALITHTDALLTTHYVYGARVYPFGYPVALFGGTVPPQLEMDIQAVCIKGV